MFKIIKLKTLVIAIVLILVSVLLSIGFVTVVSMESIPKSEYTIVIDAGHGGRDDGSTGVSGVKESEVNLKIAKKLKENLETLGINVVMTRCDGNGLYDANATNFKASDMAKRIEIIKKAKANMVISIHCNSYVNSNECGAQVFFQESDEESQRFAEDIQSQLISQLDSARSDAHKGDYYILKESPCPAVLVECGFLSNPTEEKLLASSDYQTKVSYAIMCGVVKYFNLCGND